MNLSGNLGEKKPAPRAREAGFLPKEHSSIPAQRRAFEHDELLSLSSSASLQKVL
jgi:hypothetical protein